MVNGWYGKGECWGQKGWSIGFGLRDPRFYTGTLEQAKAKALKDWGHKEDEVKWHEYMY